MSSSFATTSGLLLLLLAGSAAAAQVEIGTSTLSSLLRYSDAEPTPEVANHLVVSLSEPANAAVCRGGWISKDDGQFEDFQRILLGARLTRAPVRLLGDPNRLFPGSTDKYCYLQIVVL